MPVGHKISVFQTQRGSERTCRLTCECGLEINSVDVGTMKSWALVKALENLHNTTKHVVAEDKKRKPKKNKKLEQVKPESMVESVADEAEREMEGWKEPDKDEDKDEPELRLDEDWSEDNND